LNDLLLQGEETERGGWLGQVTANDKDMQLQSKHPQDNYKSNETRNKNC